jgi:hypothetical protein
MNFSQTLTLKTFRESLSKLATAVRTINPHESLKPGGQHGELEIQTDGFDAALTSGEKSAALEIAAMLRLYSLPEGKG